MNSRALQLTGAALRETLARLTDGRPQVPCPDCYGRGFTTHEEFWGEDHPRTGEDQGLIFTEDCVHCGGTGWVDPEPITLEDMDSIPYEAAPESERQQAADYHMDEEPVGFGEDLWHMHSGDDE